MWVENYFIRCVWVYEYVMLFCLFVTFAYICFCNGGLRLFDSYSPIMHIISTFLILFEFLLFFQYYSYFQLFAFSIFSDCRDFFQISIFSDFWIFFRVTYFRYKLKIWQQNVTNEKYKLSPTHTHKTNILKTESNKGD